ncbi:MAG TPA: fibrobacter succinogenes major paralogous domain-containing protein [Saprospiraceae bacterium]|nr:fibrobacter succinogenes major paralogous domain-containing protein [Saprospiraceae bacterium]
MRPFIHFILISITIVIFSGCGDDAVEQPIIETGTVTDVQGHVYQTVKIGNQWWMAENLNVTAYRTGEEIQRIDDKSQWQSTTMPAYGIYNNLSGPGLLYNFHVLTSGKEIAPEGWHVSTDDDWKILEEYTGMPSGELDHNNWRGTNEGDQLKEKNTNTSGWVLYEGIWGTNETGFSATGGSCRVFNGEWGIQGLRHSGFWWCATANDGYGYFRYLDYKKSGIFRYAAHPNYGFSIRCVKN